MTFFLLFVCIVTLVLLITWGKVNAFLSFLIVSILAGLLLRLPVEKIMASVQKGIGDTLGSLVIIIALGAMLGKLVADSGAAQKIASVMVKAFGTKRMSWGLMLAGFVIGIPLFYGVGFVLMVPLIFSLVYQYKLPAVQIGLPMLAALSVTHGFLPPHPSPTALAQQFNANIGLTLLYGFIVAVPAIVLAGPVFASTLKNIRSEPLQIFQPKETDVQNSPSTNSTFLVALLPVVLLMFTTGVSHLFRDASSSVQSFFSFIGDASFVMLVSVLAAVYFLGIALGKSMSAVMATCAEAVKDVGMISLIIAGAGALKQVLTDSGTAAQISTALKTWTVHPLVLGWLMAAVIRVCVGSATVAGLTTAGIITPLVAQTGVSPSLMVLSVGAGSLAFSHVNDAGFWLFKEYFNLSVKDTFKTWTAMETIVSVVGLLMVLLLNLFIH